MRQIQFSYSHCGIASDQLQKIGISLQPEIERINAAWHGGYATDYASLALLRDTGMHQAVATLVDAKKVHKPSLMVVIGVGGSNLGTMAVQQAIQGILYNYHSPLKVYFADSVDTHFTASLYALVQNTLKKQENIILVIISKSGTTTETIANAQLFTGLLARYKKSYQDYIVAISDEDSSLWREAQKSGIDCLAIPDKVGGRFSLFSPVGLFPLAMLAIDIQKLLQGAASIASVTETFENNSAAIGAAILYGQYQKGLVIHDSFFFAPRLEAIGLWCRQLIAESIGKVKDRKNNNVHVGITPTVSIGSADLHSMVQLYLSGPNNRLTTFISAVADDSITVPSDGLFSNLVPMIQGKTYAQIMDAMLEGTKKAYENSKRPFIAIELPEISAYYIGQFMQLKMIEIMYLGSLFNINPFDQPQVELYKKETRKILAHD